MGSVCPATTPNPLCLFTPRYTAGGEPGQTASIRTDLWYLKRSCPCYFRLICDETNMVHFFFGIKYHPEEHPGPGGTLGKGFWSLPLLVCTWKIHPSSTVCWRVQGHSVLSPTQVQLVRPQSHASSPLHHVSGFPGEECPQHLKEPSSQ